MNFGPSDTPPEIAKLQFELWRKLSPLERARKLFDISQRTKDWSLQALEQTRPELTSDERRQLFIRHVYGDELADRVQSYVQEREDAQR
jgi:hypothetical protein